MITKKQWKELCKKISEKRKEGKEIFFTKNYKKVQCCFLFRNEIILDDEDETKITFKNIKDFCFHPSYKLIKRMFSWHEVHYLDEE